MGQAKQRGSQSDRIEQAKDRIEANKPEKIVCNHCKGDINEIHVMDSRGMAGITAAYAGICGCGHTTLAMQGERDAIATAMMAFQDATGHEGVLGSQKFVKR